MVFLRRTSGLTPLPRIAAIVERRQLGETHTHQKNNMEHQTFQVVEWTDAHQDGLSIHDRIDMIRMEDVKAAKMVTYVEPAGVGVEPVITLDMKRYFAAGSVTTVWLCIFSLVDQGVLSGCAIFLGWVVAGGCAVSIVSIVLRSCLVWTPGAQAASGTPPPPNDGGKYEWYQEQNQRQGWRKV